MKRLSVLWIKLLSPVPLKSVLLFLLSMFLLLSCSTVPFAQRESSIDRVIELFRTGDVSTLSDISQRPYLFDGEIILLPRDIELLYQGLADGGFTIHDYTIESVHRIDQTSYAQFADSMEVKTFFSKYLEPTTVLATVQGRNGRYLLLLDGQQGMYPKIYGFKVM